MDVVKLGDWERGGMRRRAEVQWWCVVWLVRRYARWVGIAGDRRSEMPPPT